MGLDIEEAESYQDGFVPLHFVVVVYENLERCSKFVVVEQ